MKAKSFELVNYKSLPSNVPDSVTGGTGDATQSVTTVDVPQIGDVEWFVENNVMKAKRYNGTSWDLLNIEISV